MEPPIAVIGRTGTLGGNHGRAERGLRGALLAKSRAFVRFFTALQHQPADAQRRFLRFDGLHMRETLFRVEGGELLAAADSRTWG